MDAATLKRFLFQIEINTEYLVTTEGDSIPCIGIENLEGVLNDFGVLPKGVKFKC